MVKVEKKKPPDRKDRKTKLEKRKNTQETVVKCCLKSLLKDNKNILIEQIKSRVDSYSKRQCIASISLNYLLKEIFQDIPNSELRNVEIPDFNQTFMRQLLLGCKGCHVIEQYVESLYNRHPELQEILDSIPRHLSDRNIYSAGAIKLLTNVKNHFITNFPKRIKQFLYSKSVQDALSIINKNDEKSKDEKSKSKSKDEEKPNNNNKLLLFYLMNWTKPEDMPCTLSLVNKFPQEIQNNISIQKIIIGDINIDNIWLKSEENLKRMIQYSIFILRFLSLEDDKLFNLAPICKIRSHFMTIDCHSLYGILRDSELINCSQDIFKKLAMDQWKSILSVEKLQGRNKEFTGTIETDGIITCIHYTRPKNVLEKQTIENKKSEYWGCDPGRSNILQFVNEKEDGKFQHFRLTRNQYYAEAGVFKAREQTSNWQRKPEIIKVLETASLNSPKGCDVTKYSNFVLHILNVWDIVWPEYTKPKWTNQRFRLYSGKKRVFANFFNKIKDHSGGKNVVVGFGSAKFAPGGKGEISVPTSRSFKECCYRFKTIPVDEFRTTKIYHLDKTSVLQSVKRKDINKKVRGLLWCSSTIQRENKFVNRDLNAAINILHCLVLPERPSILNRSNCQGRLENIIGREIKC